MSIIPHLKLSNVINDMHHPLNANFTLIVTRIDHKSSMNDIYKPSPLTLYQTTNFLTGTN